MSDELIAAVPTITGTDTRRPYFRAVETNRCRVLGLRPYSAITLAPTTWLKACGKYRILSIRLKARAKKVTWLLSLSRMRRKTRSERSQTTIWRISRTKPCPENRTMRLRKSAGKTAPGTRVSRRSTRTILTNNSRTMPAVILAATPVNPQPARRLTFTMLTVTRQLSAVPIKFARQFSAALLAFDGMQTTILAATVESISSAMTWYPGSTALAINAAPSARRPPTIQDWTC